MRIVLIGGGSFIARHVLKAAQVQGLDCVALPHDVPLDALCRDDRVINFALAPSYRTGPYREEDDQDLRAARATARAGASFTMLSTRRVYRADSRWNAIETDGAVGDETAYGRNKACSENAVATVLEGRAGIFRLSNIFGFEHSGAGSRRTFLSLLLRSLKQQQKIFFDMHPDTRRDFLPVEICAELLLERSIDATAGIYNLGCGFATRCGDIARWIMTGYGAGELICEPMTVRDEFFLSMDKWRSMFNLPAEPWLLEDYCLELGRRLQS